jgi:hypothetical protein
VRIQSLCGQAVTTMPDAQESVRAAMCPTLVPSGLAPRLPPFPRGSCFCFHASCLRCAILKAGGRQLMGKVLRASCFHTLAEVWRGLWSHLLIIPQDCSAEAMLSITGSRVSFLGMKDSSDHMTFFSRRTSSFFSLSLSSSAENNETSCWLFHEQLETYRAGVSEGCLLLDMWP